MSIDRDAWFVDTFTKIGRNLIAADLGDTTPGIYKGALFQTALVPSLSASNPAYGSSPYNANESSGAGYTAGGADLTVVSYGELSAAGRVGWKFGVVSWADATITAAGLLVYCPTLSNRLFIMRAFGSSKFSEEGLFEITFHDDGIVRHPLWSVLP